MSLPASISNLSPNYNNRPVNQSVDMVVIHYTGMITGKSALERLCDPASKVSAHYLIEENGDIYQLVADEKRAWHAGVSYWMGQENLNDCSIGIELVNPGHENGYRLFPLKQQQSLVLVIRHLQQHYAIPARRIVGHSDIAPTRKIDPGELFDWQWLAGQGIGVWPKPQAFSFLPRANAFYPSLVKEGLKKVGYEIKSANPADLSLVIKAFQRHFRPSQVDGEIDRETMEILNGLLISLGEKSLPEIQMELNGFK